MNLQRVNEGVGGVGGGYGLFLTAEGERTWVAPEDTSKIVTQEVSYLTYVSFTKFLSINIIFSINKLGKEEENDEMVGEKVSAFLRSLRKKMRRMRGGERGNEDKY